MRLFRTTANLLARAAQWLAQRVGNEDLDDLYKSYKLFLRILARMLTGQYTNFGVFEVSFLYGSCEEL